MPVLVLLFIAVPLVELYVLIQVGQVIGALPTIALLVAMSALGVWLLRREGVRAWSRFQRTLHAGRLPTREVVDGAMVVLGGALMLTPGFVTDVVGLLLVAPPSRALLNRMVRARTRAFIGLTGPPPRYPEDHGRRVVDVEVVDVERTPPEQPNEGPPAGGVPGRPAQGGC